MQLNLNERGLQAVKFQAEYFDLMERMKKFMNEKPDASNEYVREQVRELAVDSIFKSIRK